MTKDEQMALSKRVEEAAQGGPPLTDAERAKLPEVLAFLDAEIAVNKPQEDARWFAGYVLKARPDAAELAAKLVATPAVQARLLLWVFEHEMVAHPNYCRDVVACYKRRLAGDEPTEVEWFEATRLAREISAVYKGQGPFAQPEVMVAWAACEPFNLCGIVQQGFLYVTAEHRSSEAEMDAAADAYRMRVTAKIVELLCEEGGN